MKRNSFLLMLAALWAFSGIKAQHTDKIRKLAYADSSRLVAIFQDLHRHPELGFMEVRTAGVLAKELQSLGYEVITGIGKTGLVAILKNGSGPVVGYRADMDCNAVEEITGLPYASTKTMKREDGTEVPVMHACGHDAHMTWMLGIAKIMVELKKEWKGTLVLIGQPAEEPLLGAKAMAADAVFKTRVPETDYLFALHTFPIEVGKVINGYGVRNSGSDQLDVTFYGVGGHGSTPELTKDPIVMMSNAILQYQTIISRNIGAQQVGVVTVGAIHAGGDNNVIPAAGVVKLNLRWFSNDIRNTLLEKIKSINTGIAVANGLPESAYPTITMKSSAVPLKNDTVLAKRINKSLAAVLKTEHIIYDLPPFMGSEDFTYLASEKTKSDYVFVGTAHPDLVAQAKKEGKAFPFNGHNGNYKVDLSAIPLGTVIGAVSVFEMFKEKP